MLIRNFTKLDKIKNKFNLRLVNPPEYTTIRKTIIDWVLTNTTGENDNINHKVYVYESFFSDHKPLWLYLRNN